MMTPQKTNNLERILLKVYISGMDPKQQLEIAERALVIISQPLCCDPDFTPEQQALTQENLIRVAKVQAMEEMQMIPPIDKRQADFNDR